MDKTYRNYMTLEEEWPSYGIGDPHIMKYNGMYYLYVSTSHRTQGVKVWCSENIYDWKYCGLVAEDQAATWIAYSPKTVYWNGKFYLYTTPNGQGLHVLEGKTPLGPFIDVTGKIHECIDASIFIDDDGQWYMGHGWAGIEYHKMPSPLEVEEKPYTAGTVADGTKGNNWTETGMIFKRDGRYFVTYSGNHVAGKSYRTLWASSDSVLEGYERGERPLLTNTDGDLVGTGCGLVFTGPDLLSDYVVYHNLIAAGPIRGMNIDRLSYNGTELNAFGPTPFWQARGKMPTYYDRLTTTENFTNVSSTKDGFGGVKKHVVAEYQVDAEANYVAEMNFNPRGGCATLSFSSGKGKLLIGPDGNMTLSIGGNFYSAVYSLNEGVYEPNALHTAKIDYRNGRLQIHMDEMRKFDVNADAAGGKLAYSFECDGEIGFTAITEMSSYDEVSADYRPYLGKFFAKDYAKEYSSHELSLTDGLRRGVSLRLQNGESAAYRVNAGENTRFNLSVTYRASCGSILAVVSRDGSVLDSVRVGSTDGAYRETVLSNIPLGEYYDLLTFTVLEGSVDIYAFRLYPVEKVTNQKITSIHRNGFTLMDGMWSCWNNQIRAHVDAKREQGNLIYGNKNCCYGNYR